MSKKLSEIIEVLLALWPSELAEDWDRPGLTTGNPAQDISRALLCVDPTVEVLQEAKAIGATLLICHHPVLLKGANYLAEDSIKGELISFAIRNGIAIFSAHTNADVVPEGVSDVLAKTFGLENIRPLVEIAPGIGHGRIGELESPVPLSQFAAGVSESIRSSKAPVRIAGDLGQLISKVAVVGGAGDSFIADALASGADCFVTSDLRHHVVLDAISNPARNMSLIDISHYGAESLWLEPTATRLLEIFPEVSFTVSQLSTDPWSLTIIGDNK
jgi:dinuclear metal center YbgI/SA1388 family protein